MCRAWQYQVFHPTSCEGSLRLPNRALTDLACRIESACVCVCECMCPCRSSRPGWNINWDAEVGRWGVCLLAEDYWRWDLEWGSTTGRSSCLSLSTRREVKPSALTIEALHSWVSLARSLRRQSSTFQTMFRSPLWEAVRLPSRQRLCWLVPVVLSVCHDGESKRVSPAYLHLLHKP